MTRDISEIQQAVRGHIMVLVTVAVAAGKLAHVGRSVSFRACSRR